MNSHKGFLRSKLLRRQRRTALVREAYIVATNQNCQQSSTMFFELFTTEVLATADCPKGTLALPKRSPIAAALPFDTKANKEGLGAAREVPSYKSQSGVCASRFGASYKRIKTPLYKGL
ncbi:hypothetical protein [Mesorhizobium sp. M0586]|uniref:hypothetical protein n=1 Tax=unclassified Mesorhizobium TaxID=325217 RepID=UPI00333BFE49